MKEKEIKNVRIEVRLTPREKELIKNYASAHNTTISELVRIALLNKITQN